MRGSPGTTRTDLMKPALAVFVLAVVLGGVLGLATRSSGLAGARAIGDSSEMAPEDVRGSAPRSAPSADSSSPGTLTVVDPEVSGVVADSAPLDVAGADPASGTTCVLAATKLGFGDSGSDVTCLQNALVDGGFLAGVSTGEFDANTSDAIRVVQTQRSLFVDGVVGRETAISLGIWPDEAMNVIRTPQPAAGAVDLLGYPLSSVASAGADAPPVPADSGSGRRLVYDRAAQRIWAIDDEGRTVRSWLVSGSRYGNETPGAHEVYSRSEMSTAWNGKAFLPKMVRWLKTQIGAIGFHGLPRHVEDNSPYQTEAELGTRLSGGCQRQADLDAAFTWDFAQIGTPVVVV